MIGGTWHARAAKNTLTQTYERPLKGILANGIFLYIFLLLLLGG